MPPWSMERAVSPNPAQCGHKAAPVAPHEDPTGLTKCGVRAEDRSEFQPQIAEE
jgi:hypothetical protein